MAANSLLQQINIMRQSFIVEGLVDQYFIRLENMEDEQDPNFFEDTLSMYFSESPKTLKLLEEILDKVPFDHRRFEIVFYRLRGSSVSIGANKVKNELDRTEELLKRGDLNGLKASVQQLRFAVNTLKSKLEPYFQLRRVAKAI